MITIIYEEKEYQFPESWVDVTIEQFQQLNEIDIELGEIDKNLTIISMLCGIDFEVLLNAPHTQYSKLCELITFMDGRIQDKIEDTWEYNGIKYGFDFEMTKYTTAMFLDIDYLSKDIDNLHKLVAIIYRPLDKNGKLSKYRNEELKDRALIMQKHMPISMAISAQLFFSIVGNEYMNNTKDYLEKK